MMILPDDIQESKKLIPHDKAKFQKECGKIDCNVLVNKQQVLLRQNKSSKNLSKILSKKKG